MMGKVLAAVGLALVIAAGGYFYTQQATDHDSESPVASRLRSHIPADSMAFVLNEKAFPIDFLVNMDPSLELFAQMADDAQLDGENPATRFWAHLGSDFLRAIQSGSAHLQKEWGFGEEVYSAFYFVGLSPVLEVSMAEPAKLREQVNAAAEASGLTMDSQADGEATLHRVTFLEQDGRAFTLLLRETEGWIRLALELPTGDANAALVSGSKLPAQSLATSGLLDRLHDQMSLRGDIAAAVNFVALVNTITDPQSVAGSMLSELMPDADLSQWQTPACHKESAALVSGVPEWLIASDIEYDNKAQPRTVTSESESILSIKNEGLALSLVKLNGVLPRYSEVGGYDPLYSIGLGLNVAQLAPVLMELHQAAMQPSFQCQYLQEAQTAMRDMNPTMLSMATAMVSGIKGASMTVNELAVDEELESLASASALVSVSAVSVRQLLTLVQGFVPELAQLKIPQDGSPVPLRLAMLPPQVPPLQIAIKEDQHLVVMTEDDLAQRLASTFTGLGIEGNGLFHLSADAGKLAHVFDNAVQQGVPGIDAMSAEACAEMASMVATYENTQVKMSTTMEFRPAGLWLTGSASQILPNPETFKLEPGTYDAYYVGDSCELERDGSETFRADGEGQMTRLSAAPDCDAANYEATFQWQQRGLGLHYSYQKERERENCGADWSQWSEISEGQSKRCIITEMDSSGFQCVFMGGDDSAQSYVFKRQP